MEPSNKKTNKSWSALRSVFGYIVIPAVAIITSTVIATDGVSRISQPSTQSFIIGLVEVFFTSPLIITAAFSLSNSILRKSSH